MGRLEDLRKEKEQLEQAYQNILEAGQEFQTRDGRVKQANLKVHNTNTKQGAEQIQYFLNLTECERG